MKGFLRKLFMEMLLKKKIKVTKISLQKEINEEYKKQQ